MISTASGIVTIEQTSGTTRNGNASAAIDPNDNKKIRIAAMPEIAITPGGGISNPAIVEASASSAMITRSAVTVAAP